ncbi:MAG: FAD-dependent monooxygenase [Dehalococcoidia bacterium]|nr:FAD-dependent monooxygenase [Dehalococcoidia bacterium]
MARAATERRDYKGGGCYLLPMSRFDAIVVGGGPAGGTAARELAAAGARVLVVDRAEFPRYKACGGGIPLRTEKLLPFPIDSVVEDSVSLLQVSRQGHSRFVRDSGRPFAHMVMRERFDQLLLEQAQRAGAEFRPGRPCARSRSMVALRSGPRGSRPRRITWSVPTARIRRSASWPVWARASPSAPPGRWRCGRLPCAGWRTGTPPSSNSGTARGVMPGSSRNAKCSPSGSSSHRTRRGT